MLDLSAKSQTTWLRVAVLSLIAFVGFCTRLYSVIRYESIIHEFDPWFNYRSTQYLVENKFYNFLNWYDDRSWYPIGRVVGGTVYPGIMVTSYVIHWLLNMLNFTVHIREVCVFLAPVFSGATAFATYLLTTEMKDTSAGLLAAAFIGIVPGYISRSVAGSYDNEAIAIFLLMITFYFWIKALKEGSAFYGAMTSLFYFWMVSAWGGYVFITNLIPLHVFVLILMGRFSNRIYIAYSTFYALGTLASMTIPFVGFLPTRTSEHMAALGIFGLVQLVAFSELVRSHVAGNQFKILLRVSVAIIFGLMFVGLVALTLGGYIAPWNGRFYSLWDTGYAKKYIPIIASVSEHQPTAWPSFFFDLNLLVFTFPAGVYLCFRQLRDEHIFIILYATLGSYFAGVMVRLMLTLTPCVCVAAAMAISHILDTYLKTPSAPPPPTEASSNARRKSGTSKTTGIWSNQVRLMILCPIIYFLFFFVFHCTYVTQSSYSSPSVILSTYSNDGTQHIIDDYREAYFWLRRNTPTTARVMSWWDYGYQIAGMADRTTLVDNNTWNNTHIATVGKAMSTSEDVSYKVMRRHDVDYVLIIYGGVLGYSGDDINKFLWMVRIAQGVYPTEVQESKFFAQGQYLVDDRATETMKNSLMYKMSYHRMNDVYGGQAYDRVRGVRLPSKDPELNVIEEVFSSENYIVRIFKVKRPDNIGRSLKEATHFENVHKNIV